MSIYSYINGAIIAMETTEASSIQPLHREIVAQVRRKMPQEESLYELSEFFKVFGDSTRIKILFALFTSEICVYDIAALLGMNQSAVSHQLRILKQAGLVKFRRDGKVVYYSLDDEHIQQIVHQALTHLSEMKGPSTTWKE
jgi:DNA-binding transcriptional ArsR family regulator